MKEIVDRILQEEDAARKRVHETQSQADEIILRAKEESISLINDTVKKAEDLSRQRKETFEKKFLSDKEAVLEEARENAVRSRKEREKGIVAIAQKTFSHIITIKD